MDREQKSPKVNLNEEKKSECMCPGCPTYNSEECPSKDEEKVYCSIGRTDCNNIEQRGCTCGNCPVFKECDLKAGYFCLKGEANESGEPVVPKAAN